MLESNAALLGDFTLSDELKSHFNVKKPSEEMKIWYLDTPGQNLQAENWIVRYRYHERCDFELTFKKRYAESEYASLPEGELKAFSGFKPQIDMSIAKKTYSFSCVKLFSMDDSLYDLEERNAKRLAQQARPDVFAGWQSGGALKSLNESILYGPVDAREYKGKYAGLDATFEIWKLGENLTELSFKVDTGRSAELLEKLLRDDKIKRLAQRNGTLKTEAFFSYYHPIKSHDLPGTPHYHAQKP